MQNTWSTWWSYNQNFSMASQLGEGATYKTNLKLRTNSQKKLRKVLFNKPKGFWTERLFQELGISTVEEFHEINVMKRMKHNIIT